MATIPMIVDVDTGIDDALALLYACASAEVELLAVTCVSGNVHVDHAARNSMAMLDLGGRSDVEVARGEETPLRCSLTFYEYVHGPSGLGNAVVPELARPLSERHAADLSSPLTAFLRDAVPYYFAYYAKARGFEGAAMHDPLALAAAVDPSLLRTTPVAVQVEVDGTHTTGQTVTDWRGLWEREPNLDVAVGVEGEAFLDRFVERLSGLVSTSS